jgi:regulator of PEP synthase PpsR (kinase-PPPase family)
MKKKNATEIIEELQYDNQERVMFLVDKDLQRAFKNACKERHVTMSDVIQKLMENFLVDLGEPLPSSAKSIKAPDKK